MRTCRWTVRWLLGVAVWTQPSGVTADVRHPAVVALAPAGEPGEPLLVEGRILGGGWPRARRTRGSTCIRPTRAATIRRRAATSGTRGCARRLQTDAEGRFYRLRTIKPGPYPNSGPPAHIHVEVSASPGSTERFELVFEGDARLTPDVRKRRDARPGSTPSVPPSKDADGTLRCRSADFRVR